MPSVQIVNKIDCINFTDCFSYTTRSLHNSHHLRLSCCSSRIDAFRYSFFVKSPFLWNKLPLPVKCCKLLISTILNVNSIYLFICTRGVLYIGSASAQPAALVQYMPLTTRDISLYVVNNILISKECVC